MNDFNTEDPVGLTIEKDEDEAVQATSEGRDDCLVEVAVAEMRPPPDEYETDS